VTFNIAGDGFRAQLVGERQIEAARTRGLGLVPDASPDRNKYN
jgi:hypothetical protein